MIKTFQQSLSTKYFKFLENDYLNYIRANGQKDKNLLIKHQNKQDTNTDILELQSNGKIKGRNLEIKIPAEYTKNTGIKTMQDFYHANYKITKPKKEAKAKA